MIPSGGNTADIRPTDHIALAIEIIPHSHNGAVRFKPYRMIISGSNTADICPTAYITLPRSVIPHSHDRTVEF